MGYEPKFQPKPEIVDVDKLSHRKEIKKWCKTRKERSDLVKYERIYDEKWRTLMDNIVDGSWEIGH